MPRRASARSRANAADERPVGECAASNGRARGQSAASGAGPSAGERAGGVGERTGANWHSRGRGGERKREAPMVARVRAVAGGPKRAMTGERARAAVGRQACTATQAAAAHGRR
jgi:hypothetical protein